MKMIVLALLAVLGAKSDDPMAQRGRGPKVRFDLGCVAPERVGCGCSVRVAGIGCPARDYLQVHFFSELRRGAPLWMNHDGHELSVPSVKPPGPTFDHSRGDSWVDEYRGKDVAVTITYRPGDSTCPPDKGADGCEYFDVEAEIVITMGDGTVIRYSGRGTCGC